MSSDVTGCNKQTMEANVPISSYFGCCEQHENIDLQLSSQGAGWCAHSVSLILRASYLELRSLQIVSRALVTVNVSEFGDSPTHAN